MQYVPGPRASVSRWRRRVPGMQGINLVTDLTRCLLGATRAMARGMLAGVLPTVPFCDTTPSCDGTGETREPVMAQFTLNEILSISFYILTAVLLIGVYATPGRWSRTRRAAAISAIFTSFAAGYLLIASHKATAHAPFEFADSQRSGSSARGFGVRASGGTARRSSRSSRGGGQYRRERRPSFTSRSSGRAIMAEGTGASRWSQGHDREGSRGGVFASLFAADRSKIAETKIQDCPDCPEMVVVPAAYFPLGAAVDDEAAGASERPQRTGRIGRPFAIGRLEVTVHQYRAFVRATGHRAPVCAGFDFRAAAGGQAVQCVSHSDALAYAGWLESISGERYRVPSAAEWEHAARAGAGTPYWTGRNLEPGAHAIALTVALAPDTGTHPANGFGLHDVIGGVAEIVDDCFEASLRDVPTDGTPARTMSCRHRVLKDAAWNEPARMARVSARRAIAPDALAQGVGFRVARSVR